MVDMRSLHDAEKGPTKYRSFSERGTLWQCHIFSHPQNRNNSPTGQCLSEVEGPLTRSRSKKHQKLCDGDSPRVIGLAHLPISLCSALPCSE